LAARRFRRNAPLRTDYDLICDRVVAY